MCPFRCVAASIAQHIPKLHDTGQFLRSIPGCSSRQLLENHLFNPYNKAIKEDKETDIGKQTLKGTFVITASEI